MKIDPWHLSDAQWLRYMLLRHHLSICHTHTGGSVS